MQPEDSVKAWARAYHRRDAKEVARIERAWNDMGYTTLTPTILTLFCERGLYAREIRELLGVTEQAVWGSIFRSGFSATSRGCFKQPVAA